ncbi:MAG TPA: hypothetical protein VFM54_23455 [Micromonosporaceae bacterium]|nr:hypothetical protein [Micromonosporaceae bacterium]
MPEPHTPDNVEPDETEAPPPANRAERRGRAKGRTQAHGASKVPPPARRNLAPGPRQWSNRRSGG